jgi:subfamily B ATP-binding cassette protein MsbA
MVLAIPLSLIRAAPVRLVQYLIDDILVHRDHKRLLQFPVIVVVLYLINFVVRFAYYFTLRVVVVRVDQRIKNGLFNHLLGLSSDYFTAQTTGGLISRVASDPSELNQSITSVNDLIRESLTFLVLFGYALKLNWKLTVVSFIIMPAMAWVFSVTSRNIKRYIRKLQEENAHIYATLQESFTGIRIVKTFRLEKFLEKKFFDRTEIFTKLCLKISALEEASHPTVELLIAMVIAIMSYFGGRQVLAGKITPGELLAFFTAFGIMVNPIRNLNEVNLKIGRAMGACERIFQVFDWKSHLPEPAHPVPLKEFHSAITLEHISFAYPDAPERNILKNLSLEVRKGRKIALVGASGAGKSSLVNLVPRIFDVTQGSIKIDGKDIREVSTDDLRSLIAVVSQDVFLFNDSVAENIRCGKLGATDEEVCRAAERAHAEEFIKHLPDGYQTNIGDRGQKLSGGQRQRLSIARAFLRESPILILDEATSALDTTSERAVQAALEELMINRTTLIIAHRLSTIQSADEIFVMKEGAIVESGKHEELMIRRGLYASFYESTA